MCDCCGHLTALNKSAGRNSNTSVSHCITFIRFCFHSMVRACVRACVCVSRPHIQPPPRLNVQNGTGSLDCVASYIVI